MSEQLTPEATPPAQYPEKVLEEADNAVLEAIHAIPEGSDRNAAYQRGGRIRIKRTISETHDIVIATVQKSNGTIQEYAATSELTPGHEHVGVTVSEWLVGEHHKTEDAKIKDTASKDEVGEKPWMTRRDPVKAAELKLKVADKINQVRQLLDEALNAANNDVADKQ